MLLPLGGIFLIKSGSRIIGLDIFRTQIMPFSARRIFKRLGEYGRLTFHRALLHIERTVPAVLRRKDILRLAGRNKFHVRLPGLVFTGIRQPAANHLSRRNSIGVYRQHISDAHPFRSDYRFLVLLHGGNDFRKVLLVHLFAPAQCSAFFGCFYIITGRIHTKQIRPGITEIAFFTIQGHALQSIGRFPPAHLFVRHIRNILFDIVFHLGFRQTEIRKQALV